MRNTARIAALILALGTASHTIAAPQQELTAEQKDLEALERSAFLIERKRQGFQILFFVLGWNNRRLEDAERPLIDEAVLGCADQIFLPDNRREMKEIGASALLVRCIRQKFNSDVRYMQHGYSVIVPTLDTE